MTATPWYRMAIGKHTLVRYCASVASVFAIALVFWPVYDKIQDATAASALLMVVMLVANRWGTGPGISASVLSTIYLNFFFIPPTLKLQLAGGNDFVALVTFLITSIVVGQLSARAQQKTREAQKLYDQLRATFDQSSKMEAMRQSERLKSALLDAVTHDLRTPLTSIKAAATALMKSTSKRETRGNDLTPVARKEFLSMIIDQSDRLNHFIEGMLELAKVQSGNFGEQASTDALEEIVAAALARAEGLLSHHHVKCICEDDVMVESASPRAIAQVIYSIIENATQHAPPGSEIVISAQRSGKREVKVTIEDEGPGIPSEYRQAVFEKFFHLPAQGTGVTSVSPGLGLGLAIARTTTTIAQPPISHRFRNRLFITIGRDRAGTTRVVTGISTVCIGPPSETEDEHHAEIDTHHDE
jgi:K+-sensing histidine kinase KdpD